MLLLITALDLNKVKVLMSGSVFTKHSQEHGLFLQIL